MTSQDRLLGVRAATLAAIDYAEAHGQTLPTTEQLAKHMGTEPSAFGYVVVLGGSLDEHMERVGGWPEVLVREKHAGADGKWALGFVDGMCSIQSIESYKEMNNEPALKAIEQSSPTY